MKILILKGLPASGKTTYALDLVAKSNGKWVRVNKDDIRAMVHAGTYSKSNEEFTRKVEGAVLLEALGAEKNVVVDSTNLDPSNERRIRDLVNKYIKLKWHEVEIDTKFFDVTLEECIERDAKRVKPVGETVIREMFDRYLKDRKIVPPVSDASCPWAIWADMDGTLCKINGRSPYESSRCGEDLPNVPVIETVKRFAKDHKIIIMSGREDAYRAQTEEWLKRMGVPYDMLLMRTTGDKRKDAVVKSELYRENVLGKFNIRFCLDDRNQVVEMQRNELGLTVFQVAEGNF